MRQSYGGIPGGRASGGPLYRKLVSSSAVQPVPFRRWSTRAANSGFFSRTWSGKEKFERGSCRSDVIGRLRRSQPPAELIRGGVRWRCWTPG